MTPVRPTAVRPTAERQTPVRQTAPASTAPATERRSRAGHPELPCGIGDWDKLLYGNHRFVVDVPPAANPAPAAFRVVLPWRRQDPDPAAVDIIVVSAGSGRRVRNVLVRSATRESGEFAFEAVDGPGSYYVYYLPYAMLGAAHYPQARYLPRRPTAAPGWAAAVGKAAGQSAWGGDTAELPEATALRYEAASERDSFAPMNFTATEAELQSLYARHCGEAFLLFPEDRLNPVSMRERLPAHWAIDGPDSTFGSTAQPGEDYVVQLGLHAVEGLDGVTVRVDGPDGGRCLNTEGTDRLGRPLAKRLSVAAGSVQALYVVLPVPREAAGSTVMAAITVAAEGTGPKTVDVTLDVLPLEAADTDILTGGFGDPRYLRRLAWLDSTLAQDHGLVAPFTAITLDAGSRTLGILGRTLRLAPSGLPEQLVSTFTPAMTGTDGPAVELLTAAMRLDVSAAQHHGWQFTEPEFTVHGPGKVSWTGRWRSNESGLALELRGELEADGACSFALRLRNGDSKAVMLDDVGLAAGFAEAAVPLAMGLGVPGGRRPDSLDWRWDVAGRNQDALWLGGVNAGVQLSWRDGGYERPLNTNFYREKPLREPASWANRVEGEIRGGVKLTTMSGTVSGPGTVSEPDTVQLTAFSGARTLAPGGSLDFDFRLLLTPFKPIDPGTHFSRRYFHAPADPQAIAESGATVVNIHHATAPAPYINDPLLSAGTLADYVREAHARGLRAKIYNTVRELTFHSPELLPLLSLGHEVFSDGPGEGHPWLQEHAGSGYVSAWFAPDVDDIAVVTTGESRWENFYVRSLAELAKTTGVDGIYLDDIAYDRHTMLRVRKVLERHCPDPGSGPGSGPEIDLHSANQFTAKDGFASSANLYMEQLPYVDRLWFGEYFDYDNTPPEYWLVELSGIPFGLLGEMLEGGGNPWRGMVFGMTGRAPAVDNRPLWKFWQDHDLEHARMTGFWDPGAPVRSSHPGILATSWSGDDCLVVALASWAEETVDVTLEFGGTEFGRLRDGGPGGSGGGSPSADVLHAPAIDGFQAAADYAPGQSIRIASGRGLLLTIGYAHD